MAHPSRQAFVDELVPQLPGAKVVLDRKGDRWDTGRRALLAHNRGARWHLIVQDDAILCRNFLAACELVAQDDRPVSLYTGKVRPHQLTVAPAVRKALKLRRPFVEFAGPWWGVGLILPVSHIPDLVEWGDANPQVANYDRRIGKFYELGKIPCWYTVPSLVDHRPVAENPSLVAGRTANRQAHVFIGERDPLEIDWTRPPYELTNLVEFRHRSGRTISARAGTSHYRRITRDPDWEAA